MATWARTTFPAAAWSKPMRLSRRALLGMLATAPLAPAAVAKAAPAAPTLLVNGLDQYAARVTERYTHTEYGLGYRVTASEALSWSGMDPRYKFGS